MMSRRPERNSSSRRWRLCTFRDATRGLVILLRTQPNARVHVAAAALALGAGAFFHLAAWEWIALLLAIGGVLVAEGLNTAIEFTVDLAHPDHHELAGWAKDVAAGAVLLASLVALCVGGFLFLPKLAALLTPNA